MREILFRGKRKDNGEWVYGAYYKQEHIYGYEKVVHCIITSKDVLSNDLGLDYEEVIPETVGQHTGLNDKNGTKVFEGDILRGFSYPFQNDEGEFNYYAEVVWFDDCCSFGLVTHKNPKSLVNGISDGNTDLIEDFESEDWEIIGNKWDNSELLKGE